MEALPCYPNSALLAMILSRATVWKGCECGAQRPSLAGGDIQAVNRRIVLAFAAMASEPRLASRGRRDSWGRVLAAELDLLDHKPFIASSMSTATED
jgi:hypothetical protein